jgi:hypothetical protein
MTGTSTSNTMRPDNATIGQELHGSIGVAGQTASAQRAFFTQNKYLNTGGGQWYPYTSDGRQLVQGPTWGDGMEGKALLLLVMVALGTPVRSLQRASSTRGYLNTR